MKLTYPQLAQHVHKSLAPIYLISGDEILLVQEALELLRIAARKAGFSERTRIAIESPAEWGKALYSSAHHLSLFAEPRILELDLRGMKFTQANSDLLMRYAEKPPAQTILLIQTHKLDAKATQSRWYKAIEKHGITLAIWPIPIEQLPQWIMQRAKKIDLILSQAAAIWLAKRVEGNLLAAAQEIEKLHLLHLESTLDKPQLENLVHDHAHFDIFSWIDSILAGDSQRALHISTTLLAEDTEPTLMLWALTRELRTMAAMSEQIQRGIALSTLFKQFHIWEKRQPAVRAFLQRTSASRYWEWLLHASMIDQTIKGIQTGNIQIELERLALSMTGNDAS